MFLFTFNFFLIPLIVFRSLCPPNVYIDQNVTSFVIPRSIGNPSTQGLQSRPWTGATGVIRHCQRYRAMHARAMHRHAAPRRHWTRLCAERLNLDIAFTNFDSSRLFPNAAYPAFPIPFPDFFFTSLRIYLDTKEQLCKTTAATIKKQQKTVSENSVIIFGNLLICGEYFKDL